MTPRRICVLGVMPPPRHLCWSGVWLCQRLQVTHTDIMATSAGTRAPASTSGTEPAHGRKSPGNAAVRLSEASLPHRGQTSAGGGGFLAAVAAFLGFTNRCAR